MKLLVVGGQWPPETFIARRLEGLARAGFQVTLASNRSGDAGKRLRGVQRIPLPVWSGPALRQAWDLGWMLLRGAIVAPARTRKILSLSAGESGKRRLQKLHLLLPFATQKPDVLHFEWNFAAVTYLALPDLLQCPMTISCRGAQIQVAPHNPDREVQAAMLPATFDKAAAIHCVSRAIQRQVEAMGADRGKIHVITPAVDPQLFCPVPRKQESGGGPFRVVMTGSVIWRKGYEYALQALRILIDRGVDTSMTVIGKADKTNRQRLLYTIHDLRLEGRVHLAGSLPPEQVVRALQQSSVFLLASLSEGISNAVLEAMACELPVVTTDCEGMEEAVTHGVEGFVVPVRAPERMAGALEQLARDPDLLREMGKAARARILKDFQLSRQIEKWACLYRSLHEEFYPG